MVERLIYGFFNGFSNLSHIKGDSFNPILVIVDQVTKMVYYKSIKVIIDVSDLAKVIINMVIRHHGVPQSIITDWRSLFTLKFKSLLYYFLGIKKKLFITFDLQIDGQTEKQNSIIEAYFRTFDNWEQNNWAKLLPIAEFPYNNDKNTSTDYTRFELNHRFYVWVIFKEDVKPYSRSCSASKLTNELKKLMEVCY